MNDTAAIGEQPTLVALRPMGRTVESDPLRSLDYFPAQN